MKHFWMILMSVLVVGFANAQTDVALDPEFGARVSVGLDKKIVKGFHITLSEEVRFDNNFKSFDRLQTQLGFTYKVNPYLKFGLGYILNAPYSSTNSAFKNLRHRLYFDVKGTVKAGSWAFSLKERFQWTYRAGDFNEYQYPRNALMLKSRLMVKYNTRVASPYLYFELRNFLNAPVIRANYDGTNYVNDDGSQTGAAGWFLHSFKGGYINRYRTCLGVDIKVNKHNKLDFYFLGDVVSDKVVDANAEGTKLKSYTKEHGFVGSIGAEYVFSF
ncbi:MAG: DUF2490 domain-containing protein [Bacteroidales bacterium]|nr:DUF2490 domain-containing protein [Bacteroidales bacterium]